MYIYNIYIHKHQKIGKNPFVHHLGNKKTVLMAFSHS